MKLDNFKELLLKKSEGNSNLQLLVKYIRDDYLIDHVVESLEKMAASFSKKNPNEAVLHFGAHMDSETEGGMVHDALSHHASHYKAALDAGNHNVADQHMKKIFNVMHMGEKMTRDGLNDHSSGKLKIESIDPKPWERAGYSNVNEKTGKFSTDTRGWSRSSGNQTYNWLREAPHESYKGEVKVHGHNKAYPLEEIKVNGKHIHIDDVESPGSFTEHPFDSHPIMSHYHKSPKAHGSDHHAKYLEEHDEYHADGGGMDKYWDHIESRDPAEHEARGSKKADPIHQDIEGLSLEDVKKEPEAAEASSQPAKVESLQDKLKRIREMGKK